MPASNRRSFLKSTLAPAVVLGSAPAVLRAAEGKASPTFIATWKHGLPAVEKSGKVLRGGGSLMDAVERGINVAELDPEVTSVGYGGLPNEEGVMELDASIMDGARYRSGAVCGLRNIRTPISVARKVLEETRHTTLAGEGAFRFALKMGFRSEQLLTPASLKRWEAWRADPNRKTFWPSEENHDTIGLVGIDGEGGVVSGCSTSGLAWKIAGRVGDSPLIGCGVYADREAGAASATGNGDVMTNYCTSVRIVDFMRAGRSPQEACFEMLRHMARLEPATRKVRMGVVAVDMKGEVGAAAMSAGMKLEYAVWRDGRAELKLASTLY
ncbi:MAG: N(4)-(beta-N-acetylglucosaminyl)-L-asparaginase [Acidobacteria bacterium]|nr:N(4)-(beta-N-acetylglucosaminyl)-L-asparaginase [Acidobacteriota bacterium]